MSTKLSILNIAIALMIITACSAPKNSINVENIKDVNSLKNNHLIYVLPKNIIKVEVEAIRKTTIKGIYQPFAKKYLGINTQITENRHTWEITDVKFSTAAIPDTNHIYVIESNEFALTDLLHLSPQGFLYGINLKENITKKDENITKKHITEFELKSNPEEIIDSSILVLSKKINEVPIEKKQFLQKNLEEQAAGLAEQIYNLRDDKKALMIGEGDGQNQPNADALELMLKEIDELEDKYLTLFVGKTFTEKFTYEFEFDPENYNPLTQKILFRFTPELGILSNKYIKGIPIILEISCNEQTGLIKKFQNQQQMIKRNLKLKENLHGIFYRVPESVQVKLLSGKDCIAQKQLFIAQYGVTQTLPLYMMQDYNYSIQFYPETGAIKSIQKNNFSTPIK